MALRAFYVAWLMASIGFLGALAFNPDDGAVLRSEPLWTCFGIAAYAGALALYPLALIILVSFLRRVARRLCRRGVTSLA